MLMGLEDRCYRNRGEAGTAVWYNRRVSLDPAAFVLPAFSLFIARSEASSQLLQLF